MSDQFAVNEVAIFQNADYFLGMNGLEVNVDLPLGRYLVIDPVTRRRAVLLGYGIELPDGQKLHAAPHQLKKKRPPASDKGERRIMELFVPVEQPEMVAG